MLTPADFYVLRVPGFSIDRLFALNRILKQRDITAAKAIFQDEYFLQAIYFSSRYFYKTAKNWLQEESITFDSKDKVLISLYKYYNRICTRCTPYGLFAGFASGKVSRQKSNIAWDKDLLLPIVRPDMLFLKKIKDEILQNHRSKKIIYYPNNTLYKAGNALRFIAWDTHYNYEISEVKNSHILDLVIQAVKDGLNFSQITAVIAKELTDFDKQEIEAYIHLLIRNKILVDRLPPYMTGVKDPLNELEAYLKKTGIENTMLKDIKASLKHNKTAIDLKNITRLAHRYKKILDEKTQLFQVDLQFRLTKNNIHEKVVQKLSKNAYDLQGLAQRSSSDALTAFCKRYYSKFGDQEIPLVHALDPQLGVGYGLQISGNVEETPLLKDIYFSYKENNPRLEMPPILSIILEKYLDHFNSSVQNSVVLSADDLSQAAGTNETFPLCEDYYLFGDLLTHSLEDLDRGIFKFHCKASCPSPYMNNILSRFSYHDEKLRDKLHQHIRKTLNGVIPAEIIHHPSDRLGNVLLRPDFYDNEIPYVTESNKKNHRMDINDLRISVKGNRIILRSRSLNKEIRPRLSSAYNYTNNQLSVIRFLCDLQYHQKYMGFDWDWSVLNDRSYLPRVEYKEFILTEARWKLEKNKNHSINTLKDKIKALNIPQYCNLKDRDHVLLLDTTNELCLTLLLRRIKKYPVFLYESLNESYFISKNQQKYAAEFIFPLINPNHLPNRSTLPKTETKRTSQTVVRNFYPGDEWSCFKIYCSHSMGDRIINEVIKPLIEEYAKENIDLFWFFIRYEDPEHHIRLRVKTQNIQKLILQLRKQVQPLIKEGHVFSLSMETYQREIERYGADTIELSEQLFHYDSLAVMKGIELLNKVNDENIRWKIGLVSIDLLLDDFKLPLPNRVILLEKLYKGFMPEYVYISHKENNKLFKASADKQLRAHKQFLDNVLRLKKYTKFTPYVDPFLKRSHSNRTIVPLIKVNLPDNKALADLLQSYLHMALNRWFCIKPRMHEFIIYFFMYKTYNSIAKRNEKP